MSDDRAPMKDPILGEPMLTPVEHEVYGQQMKEHREQKCGRCIGRFDLSDGGYVCDRGLDAEKVRRDKRPKCARFRLDPDQGRWLE